MTALDEARRLGKAESEIVAIQDLHPIDGARALGIDPGDALIVAGLGAPLAVPGAPTVGAVVVVDADTVTVAFTPPVSDGGLPITGYTVTSTPGSFTGSGTTSPITVNGAFVQDTAYTFHVTAANSKGTSAASAESAASTPNPAPVGP